MKATLYVIAGLAVWGVVIFGCVSSSDVFPTGRDTYTVIISSNEGETTNMGDLARRAYKEANDFCQAQGKMLQPIATTAKPFVPGGSKPYYELRFRALNPDDPEYRRPTLRGVEGVPDATIERQTH